MKILFNLEYQTVFGEELVLNVMSENGGIGKYKMNTLDGRHWFYDLSKHVEMSTYMDYFYTLVRGEEEMRHEWLVAPHRVEFVAANSQQYIIYDHWIDIPEDAYLYSSAFTECVMYN